MIENLKPFKPGQSGNPLGHQNEAKRSAGRQAWKVLLEDFMEHGAEAIVAMRDANPTAYVQLVASGLPTEKSIDLTTRRVESLSEEQSRMMAEEILERHKRRTVGAELVAGVHDSDEAGLPARATAQAD